MDHILYLPAYEEVLSEYNSAEDLKQFYQNLGCQGLEIIDCNDDQRQIIAPEFIKGLHLSFQAYWVDFFRGNQNAVLKEFLDRKVVEEFFGGSDPDELIKTYRKELDNAEKRGVDYVVFHVSDVTIHGVFTHQHQHSDGEVIDAASELINIILKDREPRFDFLMENLWWPGLNLTDAAMTKKLLDQVSYSRKGLMLDIGHLLHTNLELSNEEEACAYVHKILDEHDSLRSYIKGVHLHQTLQGSYVKSVLANPPALKSDYYERFAQVYEHIGRVDAHQPFHNSCVEQVIERIQPRFLVHELMAVSRKQREQALRIQRSLFR